MKERSVAFYKRLIIFTALSIIMIIAGLLTFFIGSALDLWGSPPKEEQNLPAISSSTDQQKVVQSGMEKENTTTNPAVSAQKNAEKGNVVYLTFDDGSSRNTDAILELLQEEQVPATFFFNTSEKQTADSIIKKAYDAGHAIGVLTSTRGSYNTLYASVESYVADFNQSYNRILQVTGQAPSILRFPGGSINDFDRDNYKDLIQEVEARGLVYFDWNVCADDGSANISAQAMVAKGTRLPKRADTCVVLMHDNGNSSACEALKEIIGFYKENGYAFETLTADVQPITF
ncbi:polysaccharide deacetylase family protein [Aminipila butyrica]|uniref:Polysaccharide deacetylase family protein n=1 Tax=Aminipila butyrica TaxID=433296 RepID=A0A858BY59_9FIRM|nr:polysaccharide deacetylase family protein [Aminipila butyrica]QIB70139.1 polysaccharide deacetylase family protein [Aminipila butyrica]